MTEKLTDNASLRELIIAFESIKNGLQINKNNIIDAIGNPATLNDKLSTIPSRITTEFSKRKICATGVASPNYDLKKSFFIYKNLNTFEIKDFYYATIDNLAFEPSLIAAYSGIYNGGVTSNSQHFSLYCPSHNYCFFGNSDTNLKTCEIAKNENIKNNNNYSLPLIHPSRFGGVYWVAVKY
ncbi:TPA: hypothetical protein KQC86_003285 [Clostridioides difficile]|uniref:hypothetical protein n=1 Tax=Clostridioides difficile TaxID=1496 RepID=UPI001C187308|nr:hypothetical protein [Clostridioides difficile]HBF2286009.1 hypothetical protein [Clostridioides difficile]HBF5710645.1 hypothetical protein [Clostridioides difficile]HBF6678497.1 hypothetical protein [Clostridioides difficile]HBF9903398.1 hypothetical protein [Clostridioides difficile]